MGNKGKSRHMKGLNAPKYYAIHRKEQRYVAKALPGRHNLQKSITLLLFAKKTGLAETVVEAKKIIKGGLLQVNGMRIIEPKYSVGLNDTVGVEDEKKFFKIGINELGHISISDMAKPDYDAMVYKVVGKYKADGEKIMLRLHDGSAISGSNDIKVNDSVVLDSKKKVVKVLKLGVGSECAVVDGVHVGTSGKVKELAVGTMHKTQGVTIEQKNGTKFETLVKNIMVTS